MNNFCPTKIPIIKPRIIEIILIIVYIMIEEIFKTRMGVIILSVIWGLGLSTIFRKACNGRTCQIVRYIGPDPQEVEKQYYNYGTKSCYQYQPVIASCDAKIETVKAQTATGKK